MESSINIGEFRIYGNYYIYDEKLENDRGIGIQDTDKGYSVFVSDKEGDVEEIIHLDGEKDLKRLFDAVKLMLQIKQNKGGKNMESSIKI